MGKVRNELIAKLWNGVDPFGGAPLLAPDATGYSTSQHRYLTEAVEQVRPRIIIEVGVWKGLSGLVIGRKARQENLDCAIIAVDTWLGNSEHWTNRVLRTTVTRRYGYPTTFHTFISNVIHDRQAYQFVPLPLDSVNAAEVLKHYDVSADLIHIDAGHDYTSVMTDLRTWWPLLREGGVLVGDDYYTDGNWPGVKHAFDEFFESVEHDAGKCRVHKSAAASRRLSDE